MSKVSFPTNRPSRCDSVRVNRTQFNHIFTDSAVAAGEKIASDLAALKDDIADACDKRFVFFKNKKVWFDREVAGLYPRMEQFPAEIDIPIYRCDQRNEYRNSFCWEWDGFTFTVPTVGECQKTFRRIENHPYIDDGGNLKYRKKSVSWTNAIIAKNTYRSDIAVCSTWYKINEDSVYLDNSCGGRCCGYTAYMIPIYRLNGENAPEIDYINAICVFIANGLIPEGLSRKQEDLYKEFMVACPKIEDYIQFTDEKISFDSNRFKDDVLSGQFTDTVFGHNFDIRGTLEGVLAGKQKYTGSVDALKQELLCCDEKRANIEPYEERQLTDVNRGHWELFEEAEEGVKDEVQVELPKDELLYARPPQLDVRLNGTCAIDFGTKSTIVVCRDGEARMLRIGKGDYSKAPTIQDFENPTAIELRDINGFLAAYRNRIGRPFTEWNQVTVSHQAAEAIFREQGALGSSVYNSVFDELKQWAKDENNWPILKDLQGNTQEIKPYLETSAMDDGNHGGDFDPIELYAYYLGLYINNMHHQIYLDYILSYPVNYKKEVREHIRASFERGLKKSLPPALQKDKDMMQRFRVYLGASEPAAYAISALEGFGLEPKEPGEQVAYGVFDFGGGTTDFDFGIEYVPEKRNRNFVIEQFGFNGDVHLGGENILELLAYEVYKDNLSVMREKKIPFALPPDCDPFAGSETLVRKTKDASSHMNNRILAKTLRPIWEHTDGEEELTGDTVNVKLFSSDKDEKSGSYSVGVDIKIDAGKLEKVIENRIRQGVENFFQSLYSAFKGKKVYPIHIFLAGNSCRSPLVKKLFEEFIEQEEEKMAKQVKEESGQDKETKGTFILHMPLSAEEETKSPLSGIKNNETVENNDNNDTPSQSEDKKELLQQVANAVKDLSEKRSNENADATGESAEQSAVTPLAMDFDRKRTGKTGVAFGLLRCRRGGKDVKIINRNVDESGEMIFPYFLGDAGTNGNQFTVRIGRNVGYGVWTYFTVADEPEFELYYSSEPRALQGILTAAQVSMVHCLLDDDEVNDDEEAGIYIRKVAPNLIEYAVGYKSDFDKEDDAFKTEFQGKIHQQSL